MAGHPRKVLGPIPNLFAKEATEAVVLKLKDLRYANQYVLYRFDVFVANAEFDRVHLIVPG